MFEVHLASFGNILVGFRSGAVWEEHVTHFFGRFVVSSQAANERVYRLPRCVWFVLNVVDAVYLALGPCFFSVLDGLFEFSSGIVEDFPVESSLGLFPFRVGEVPCFLERNKRVLVLFEPRFLLLGPYW